MCTLLSPRGQLFLWTPGQKGQQLKRRSSHTGLAVKIPTSALHHGKPLLHKRDRSSDVKDLLLSASGP